MRWTQELNECVMRAYYEATDIGINLTSYRSRLLPLFQTLQPGTDVTAQRLSDQVRTIQRLHLLDESTLDRLRDTVRANRMATDTGLTSPSQANTIMDVVSSDLAVGNVSIQNDEQLRRALEDAMREYRSRPTLCRPRLPRLPLHKNNLMLMGAMDSLLAPYFRASNDLVDTHSILYCGAIAVCQVAGAKQSPVKRPSEPAHNKPTWQIRIEKRIDMARTLIAKLICFRAGNCRPRVMRYVTQAFADTGVTSNEYLARATERIDFWKQKVYAWANRIRRYKERATRYFLNRTFQSEEKRVYRSWERTNDNITDMQLPTSEAMTSFWRNIWSMHGSHTEGDWIEVVKQSCEQASEMEPVLIEPLDVGNAIRLSHNWKSPGPDGLHNFWIKWFKSSHGCLATQFQEAINNGSLPTFMTTGVTHLLHKSGCTTDPKNYRPITCLPTIYKILTSILSRKLITHINNNKILAITQNGCKAGSRGTKELLLFDMAVSQQVRKNRRNLSVAWIDYKKAYDSVPHTWLVRILELYKIDNTLRSFLRTCMGQWVTVLKQPGMGETSELQDFIKIERGIFQGDSLSPLWFCLALNPLSALLEDSKLGYRFRRGSETMSHLLYMDDLKLFASNEPDLIALLNTTLCFSNAINMEFGIDKCAVMHVRRGKVVNSPNLQLSGNIHLKSLSETETYKYLGMSESLGIANADVKQSVRDRFFGRLRKVLSSLLSGGNKVRAFNGWVMPVLAYSFGILRWTQTELDALDRRVRCLLTKYRMHHPRSSVMRLYIPRRYGGRGFLNVKDLHNREVNNLREYFLKMNTELHKDVVSVDKGLTPLSLAKENWCNLAVMSTSNRTDVWKGKELHGRFYRELTGPDIDLPASVNWLQFGNLFGETEGFVFAIMDEVIKTNNYRKYILKDNTPDICRACRHPGESLRHIVSGCSHLSNGEYLHRHNLVARIIHQQLALRYGLVESEVPYYQYLPEPVLENGHATLYWDRSIITDRTIIANKPDIVIVDRSARRAMLVDISIPHDINLVKKEKEKLSKYLDLAHEVTAMWRLESTSIVPIVVSVNGLIAKSLDRYLERLSLGHWVKGQIQKAVILDTARIVRRFLSLEP